MEMTLPRLGEVIRSGVVLRILVAEGDRIDKDQAVLELETGDGTTTVPAAVAGCVAHVHVSEGDEVYVGDKILSIEEQEEPKAAPAVRAFAKELGLDVQQVTGTGPGGRVTRDDVKRHVRDCLRGRSGEETVEEVSLSEGQQRSAKRLSATWGRVVHVTQEDEADITDLDEFRRKLARREDAPITLTAVFAAVTARTLRRFPEINSTLDLEHGRLIVKRYIHLGIAVDTARGLQTPVLKNADRMGIVELAERLDELAQEARDGKLTPESMQGASFTIANLGGLGTTHFTPIVSWPQVAILGVGRARVQATWDGEAFVPRSMLPLAISYDHRAIDGADAARFLRTVAETLEQPANLLLL